MLSILPPLPQRRPSQPAGSGPLAGLARQPAVGAGDHEPPVGRVLRPRTGAHRGRFRLPGRAAQPPRAARLARPRAAPPRLVDEANAQVDRHERDLSAVVAGDARAAGEGPGKPPAGPRPARPPGGRGDPRRGLARQRLALGARSAARASSRPSRPASRPRGPTAASTGKSARGATAIAGACTPSPSAPLRSPWRRRSTLPAARSASPAARFPTRRCRH